MSLIINILLFLLIFGYAAYTLMRFFKKSKEGKCNSCEIDSCGCEVPKDIHHLTKK